MGAVEVVGSGPVVDLQLTGAASALWAELASVGRGLDGAVRVVTLRGSLGDALPGSISASDSVAVPAWAPDNASHALDWLRRPDLISVAVIDHRAVGPGLAIALACDLRAASTDAEIGAGATPDVDLAVRLGDLVGPSRALELLLTGRRLSAHEAADLGIVELVSAADELDAAVRQLVDAVLGHSRAAVTELKALLAASGFEGRQRAADLVADLWLAAGDG